MPVNPEWAESHKPSASARTQLALAGAMWSLVGAGLLALGVHWAWHPDSALSTPLLAAALVAGGLKSRFVLDRAGRRIVERIERRGDGRCLGGFVSPATWLLILLMMASGRLLRAFVPHVAVGILYVAVGCALLISSRLMWQARFRRDTSEG